MNKTTNLKGTSTTSQYKPSWAPIDSNFEPTKKSYFIPSKAGLSVSNVKKSGPKVRFTATKKAKGK